MRLLRAVPVLLLAALAAAAEPAPITLGDREVVVIYGDSITEQNLYAAFIESFLLTRFPSKDLRVYNFGWGGDTANGGDRRFARDVAPVKPTLVTVDFGMNDGRYTSVPDQAIRESYLAAQRRLAATIKATGAREILLTTSPVDPDRRQDKDAYNEALALMADGVLALGGELALPTVDIFHPMRAVQRQAKAANPAFTMIPDSVHPDASGHLVMAYQVLRRLDCPKAVGAISIADGKIVASGGASVANLVGADGTLGFDLTLAFLPCPVPAAARPALALVPFQQELNSLVLTVAGLDPAGAYSLTTPTGESPPLSGAQLAAGVDIATLEGAPWTIAGNRLWDLGQQRWQRHFDAWRKLGMTTDPTLVQMPAFAALTRASADYAEALAGAMREAARPGTWHLTLARSHDVAIASLELAEPVAAVADFATRYQPETAPETVAWRQVPFSGELDFTKIFGAKDNCVVHARLVLEADRDCVLDLALGSDDGLVVSANGTQILARNVSRGVKAGEDHVQAKLVKGRNTLFFRVTQGSGGYGLAVSARVKGEAVVRQFVAAAKP